MIRLQDYCKDYKSIENYSEALKDNFNGWHIHHRLELDDYGKFQFSKEDLIAQNRYFNVPADELIFLRESEHKSLHAKGMSDKTRQALSKASSERKRKPHTEETKQKISKTKKGVTHIVSKETGQKISEALKNKYKECPMTEETKQKIRNSKIGSILSDDSKKKVSKNNSQPYRKLLYHWYKNNVDSTIKWNESNTVLKKYFNITDSSVEFWKQKCEELGLTEKKLEQIE